MQKNQPNFHPITKALNILEIIRGMLNSSKQQLENMQEAKNKPHLLDDEIINLLGSNSPKLHFPQTYNLIYCSKQFSQITSSSAARSIIKSDKPISVMGLVYPILSHLVVPLLPKPLYQFLRILYAKPSSKICSI